MESPGEGDNKGTRQKQDKFGKFKELGIDDGESGGDEEDK